MAFEITDEQVADIVAEYRPYVVEGEEGQLEELVRKVVRWINGSPEDFSQYPSLVVTAIRIDVEKSCLKG